ncbi:lysyl oxidase family protein [Nocardioides rubriscoriae]|uniref:lysyl oxidase family protein n=1 Tax=Nocardioides rubriscoriae TaxID=642762 RepID=UPI0011DFDBEA|nr:lysyl oxidase family protein [Nocardioides rubriscoriae]
MKLLRWTLVLVVIAAGTLVHPPDATAATASVTVGSQSHVLNGTDIRRLTDYLVEYTPVNARTGTNQYGFEAAVVDGKVTRIEDGVGNMAIPSNGFVLSGHGEARTWLRANAKVGVTVSSGSTPPPTSALLPDVGIRTLRQFTISTSNGVKLLKFPAVTANVGNGPMEILGTRTSSTSVDWVGRQIVTNSDGSRTTLPDSGATFYYAGDGHNHWHIRDFDLYQLFNAAGTVLKEGEKHGYCFEDNTTYRDWVGSPKHPNVPLSPVYTHEGSCGEGQPQATRITHGLSVGWADTYPSTLPDQGINITGVPDGTYLVKVTADWQNFWRETNEGNNAATAKITISGNSVTLVSATDGL